MIGARRQVYAAAEVKSGAYREQPPAPIAWVAGSGQLPARTADSVYHWLLPDTGLAAFDTDKVIKELAPDEVKAIKDWRKTFTGKFAAEELKNLIQKDLNEFTGFAQQHDDQTLVILKSN